MSDDSGDLNENLAGGAPAERHVLLSWVLCVGGWLFCAFVGLWLVVELEAWPKAYNVFFWTVVALLFCNALLFLAIPYRWSESDGQIIKAVGIICAAEVLVFGAFYLVGRFAIAA